MAEDPAIGFLAQFKKEGSSIVQAANALDMDPDLAQDLAMDLVARGLLNIVSLSGKMSLTKDGLAMLGDGPATLGPDSLASLAADLETAADMGLTAAQASDLAADLACIKAQLGRSQPLAKVVGACLEAIAETLKNSTAKEAKALAERALSLTDQKPG